MSFCCCVIDVEPCPTPSLVLELCLVESIASGSGAGPARELCDLCFDDDDDDDALVVERDILYYTILYYIG